MNLFKQIIHIKAGFQGESRTGNQRIQLACNGDVQFEGPTRQDQVSFLEFFSSASGMVHKVTKRCSDQAFTQNAGH